MLQHRVTHGIIVLSCGTGADLGNWKGGFFLVGARNNRV